MEIRKLDNPGARHDIGEIGRQMDVLEQRWYDAWKTAARAAAELAVGDLNESNMRSLTAERDLAEHAKKEIMREIEALEDSLLD